MTELRVNGYLSVEFFEIDETGEWVEVDEAQALDITIKLQSGEYVISINDKKVYDLETFQCVCVFNMDPTDHIEYEWTWEG